jgi:heterodisulfide reductase subunit A
VSKARVGVYVCHCGLNIAGVVDVKRVVDHAKTLKGVVVARDHKYVCSDSGQELIKRDIKEFNLNRIVVASCSPRMHESTFRKTIEQSGLNPYLFEMVNIREQCSWVHLDNPEEATIKAIDLVRMAIIKAKLLEPLEVKEVETINSVLVIGGGIAGIQTALDLVEQGFKVYLVEKRPSIGGHMAQLDKTFPTMDCSICILAPKMVDVAKHPNIVLLTYSTVQEVSGNVGNFHVRVLKKPRYVDEEKCVGCGICATKCPVKCPNEFNIGLNTRKAIYVQFPQSVPLVYTIDQEHCLYFTKGVCKICEKFCEAKAIDFNQKERIIEFDVGAIVVAVGYEPYDPSQLKEYGYTVYKNVITSLEFERLVNAAGPTEGKLLRPSDRTKPHRIAFIQCVGSRDERVGHIYCSKFCCMGAAKQARQIKEKIPDAEVYIFHTEPRAFGKGFEEFFRKVREYGVHLVRGRASKIMEDPETGTLTIFAEDLSLGKPVEIDVDLVILSIGMVPSRDLEVLSRILRIPRGSDGFLLEAHPKLRPVDTYSAGIFLAGTCQGPKDISDTVTQAKAAASSVAALLSRGKIRVESMIAHVNQDLCIGCGLCQEICPYQAMTIQNKKSKTIPALCGGCGTCASTCPEHAITMKHYTNKQILAQVTVAFQR